MSRRAVCGAFATLAGAIVFPPVLRAADRFGPAQDFSWDWLVRQARTLAAQTYRAPALSQRPAENYDAAVRLTYGKAERIAGNIRLFPTTRDVASHPVAIHILSQGKARLLVDSTGLFVDGQAADVAGFRIMQDLSQGEAERDWLAFLGASYFRSSGASGQYGLSARAVAVNIGLQTREEFPAFTQFWIEQLGPAHYRIYALLDGPSLSGAFSCDSTLDAGGVEQQIRIALFARQDIERLGLAPITSMFWYDQGHREKQPDWRPEIHDSDGLALDLANGERIWRPLVNPPGAQVNAFEAAGMRGFGLLQRDRNFASYQDDSAFYDRRPNLWVEPQGDWGAGAVMLYEMPTSSETIDNIGAFWVGAQPLRKGQKLERAYRLRWTSADPTGAGIARLVDRFAGAAGIPGAPPVAGAQKYVFDFEGKNLAGLTRDSGVVAVTNLPDGALMHAAAYPVVGQDNRWRAMIDVKTAQAGMREFRIYLRRGNDALSETVIQPLELS